MNSLSSSAASSTNNAMTTQEAFGQMLEAKNRNNYSSQAIGKVIAKFLKTNPQGNLQELEKMLRSNELNYIKKLQDYDEEYQKLDQAYVFYMRLFNQVTANCTSEKNESEEDTFRKRSLSYLINILKEQGRQLMEKRRDEEDYRIYLFASPFLRKKGNYELKICTYPREEANEERLKYAPTIQVNYDRLKEISYASLSLNQLDDYLCPEEMHATPLTEEEFRSIINVYESCHKTIDDKINALVVTSQNTQLFKNVVDQFYKELDETVLYLNNILLYKMNLEMSVIAKGKEQAKAGMIRLKSILENLPELPKKDEKLAQAIEIIYESLDKYNEEKQLHNGSRIAIQSKDGTIIEEIMIHAPSAYKKGELMGTKLLYDPNADKEEMKIQEKQ